MKLTPAIIDMIVSRCHVSESNLSVIRYLISRLVNKHRTFRSLPRETRRQIMREAIRVHDANRHIYACVMTGRF
jgi:hypothetical protein